VTTSGRSGSDAVCHKQQPDQRLLEEYRIQVQSLANHYTRLWTRFNFFITLQTALLVALVGLFRDRSLTLDAIPLTGLGVFMGLIWYVIGAQDRYLVTFYRRQIEYAADRVAPEDKQWPHLGREVEAAVEVLAEAKRARSRPQAESAEAATRARGREEVKSSEAVTTRKRRKDTKKRLKEAEKEIGLATKLYQWRFPPLSVTRFPAELPMIVTVLWSAATIWVAIEAS
jgi:hypothetical protein